MTDEASVRHLGGDRFSIGVREHTVLMAQPVGAGGADTAPTPTELFVAGLASCVAFYARRYAAGHRFSAAGLEVAVTYELGGRPARVSRNDIVVTPSAALSTEHRDAFPGGGVALHGAQHPRATADHRPHLGHGRRRTRGA